MLSLLNTQAVTLLNMKTLQDRLREAMAEAEMSQAELARRVKVTRGAISLWLSGATKELSSDNLMAAAEALRVSPVWLGQGKGPKHGFSSTNAPRVEDDRLSIPRFDTGGSMGGGVELRDQPGMIESLRVNPEWLQKNLKSYTSPANLCVVTGFGDSMEPMFHPGDPLIVDLGVTVVEFDAVYFFRVENEGFIKRLQRIPTENGMILRAKSENKEYDAWDIKPGMDFEVFGRVLKVWCSRDF